MKRTGVPIIICAPSGTGKTTLTKRLQAEFPSLHYSVSYTTRKPRPNEQNGKDYNFVSVDEFLTMRDAGAFAEYAKVHGNYYATPLKGIHALLSKGIDLLFDIDVHGASQLKVSMPTGHFIFLFAPSLKVLFERLQKRGMDDSKSIELRRATAIQEINESHWFDAWIVNDDLEKAYDELRSTYISACLAPSLRPRLTMLLLEE
jgi:guanylate kinase